MVALSLPVAVGCSNSQSVSSSEASDAARTSRETELPVMSEAPDFELTNQDGMIQKQYLGLQMGGQVFSAEDMLEDVKALLGAS